MTGWLNSVHKINNNDFSSYKENNDTLVQLTVFHTKCNIFRPRGVRQHPPQCGHRTCHLVRRPPPASRRSRLPHLQDVEHRQECHQEGRQPALRHRLRGRGGRDWRPSAHQCRPAVWLHGVKPHVVILPIFGKPLVVWDPFIIDLQECPKISISSSAKTKKLAKY